MINTIFSLTIITVIVFIVSCRRCDKENEYYYLDPADSLVYKLNDELIYKNNYGGRDTFKLHQMSNNTIFYPYGGYCEKKGKYLEYLNYSFKDTSSFYSSIHFEVGSYFYFTWIRTTFSTGGSSTFTILPEYQFHGSIYSNVYFFTLDTTISTSSIVWKAYFSKSQGVLSCTEKNGTIWELEQVITQNK